MTFRLIALSPRREHRASTSGSTPGAKFEQQFIRSDDADE